MSCEPSMLLDMTHFELRDRISTKSSASWLLRGKDRSTLDQKRLHLRTLRYRLALYALDTLTRRNGTVCRTH